MVRLCCQTEHRLLLAVRKSVLGDLACAQPGRRVVLGRSFIGELSRVTWLNALQGKLTKIAIAGGRESPGRPTTSQFSATSTFIWDVRRPSWTWRRRIVRAGTTPSDRLTTRPGRRFNLRMTRGHLTWSVIRTNARSLSHFCEC